MGLSNASLTSSGLTLSTTSHPLILLHLRWQPLSTPAPSASTTSRTVRLPVYLNEDRQELLFECELAIAGDESEGAEGFVKRGVALTA